MKWNKIKDWPIFDIEVDIMFSTISFLIVPRKGIILDKNFQGIFMFMSYY